MNEQEALTRKLYLALVILSIAVVLMAAGLYASPRAAEENTLSVSGTASMNVSPDTASLSLGVLAEAATAKEASDRNAASMNAVISELKAMGLEDKDLQTSYLSLQPVYRYPQDGAPTIAGYSASNSVQVTTTMLDRLGEIVDRSVAAGANQVGGIAFIVSEERQKELRDELVEKAVEDASSKARGLAESLDVRIVGVKTTSIGEGAFPPIPMFAPMVERAVTPIQPGESIVTLSVQVTYIIK